MVRLNIDALSIPELRYIAEKNGIEDAQDLGRNELLELMQELFDETNEASPSTMSAPSSQKRFFNTLVDHYSEGIIKDLPGTETLPDGYSETEIHLLLKDPYWAHAYWSISLNDHFRLEQADDPYRYYLRVDILDSHDDAKDQDHYEIQVQKDDRTWNVNLPLQGKLYKVSLRCAFQSGKDLLLCQSDVLRSPTSYWLDHAQELAADNRLFTLMFMPMVTKGGVLVGNPLVNEIALRMDRRSTR